MTTTADTAELLRRFFIQQQAVNLPGIGGFVMNRIPAHVDGHAGIIVAPSYTIKYDSLNDIPSKAMFAYVAAKKDITEWEAIGVVNHFSQEINDMLMKGQMYEWGGMGRLQHNDAGQLIFESGDMRYPFYPDVQGAYEWREYREPEPQGEYEMPIVETQADEETVVEARASWWISAAVIAAVASLLILFSLVRNEYKFRSARESRLVPAEKPLQYQFKPAE
jgi:hypothetical protein